MIGWLPAMRLSPQIQLTDFENAAYVVTVVLLTRAILSFKLNFYIPVTKVGLHLNVQAVTHPVCAFGWLWRLHNVFTSGLCVYNN